MRLSLVPPPVSVYPADDVLGHELCVATEDLHHAFRRFEDAPTFRAEAHAAEAIVEKAAVLARVAHEYADRLEGL